MTDAISSIRAIGAESGGFAATRRANLRNRLQAVEDDGEPPADGGLAAGVGDLVPDQIGYVENVHCALAEGRNMGRSDVEVKVRNLAGEVVEQTGAVEEFEILNSFYHGVDDGESWSEGSSGEVAYISGLPKGTYMLRIAPSWEEGVKAPPVRSFRLTVKSGVFRWIYPFLALLAILLWPLIQVLRVSAFEGRRWQESMYSGSSSGGGD